MIKNKDIIAIEKQIDEMNKEKTTSIIFSESNNNEVQALVSTLNIFISDQKKKNREDIKLRENYQRMLSNISHDIRTPLTVIKGISELIDIEAKSADKNILLLAKMKTKVQEVQDMMNYFFDLNKLEADDTNLVLKQIDITRFAKKIILQYYDIIEDADLTFDIKIPDAALYILANEEAMGRIIENLLTNAIKYGNAGKIIGFRIKEKQDEIELIVWDKGKGIDEKYYDAVFERLFTLEDSRNKNYSGSGLGLTITKRLVEKQMGTMQLASTPYQYTEFKIIFKKATK